MWRGPGRRLERASDAKVHGFRIGHQWFAPDDLWALDVLAEEGFAYDSSVRPLFGRYARNPGGDDPTDIVRRS